MKNKTILLTGIPCSGKTTIAENLITRINCDGIKLIHLDGDDVRTGLCKGLGFTKEGRDENLKRIAYVANIINKNNLDVILSFVSPMIYQREMMKEIIEPSGRLLEVYVYASLEECMKRDVKGMYAKAVKGEIKEFTGYNSSYETPENPDLVLNTEILSIEECIDKVYSLLR